MIGVRELWQSFTTKLDKAESPIGRHQTLTLGPFGVILILPLARPNDIFNSNIEVSQWLMLRVDDHL